MTDSDGIAELPPGGQVGALRAAHELVTENRARPRCASPVHAVAPLAHERLFECAQPFGRHDDKEVVMT